MSNDFSELVKDISTEELFTRVKNFDQWQPDFIKAAKDELIIRKEDAGVINVVIDIRKSELEKLEYDKHASTTTIILCYTLVGSSLISVNPVINILALIILLAVGTFHLKKFKTSKNEAVYKFRKKDRSTFGYLIGIAAANAVIKMVLFVNFFS